MVARFIFRPERIVVAAPIIVVKISHFIFTKAKVEKHRPTIITCTRIDSADRVTRWNGAQTPVFCNFHRPQPSARSAINGISIAGEESKFALPQAIQLTAIFMAFSKQYEPSFGDLP